MEISKNQKPGIGDLQAVLLVGGKGTRLSGVVGDRPKVMAEVGGVPFIDWILSGLFENGIRRVVLCTGYLRESIESHIEKLAHCGMEIRCSPESHPLGTGGALRQALPLLNSDPVFVLNGDSWCDFDAVRFLEWHRSMHSEASLLLSWVDETSRFGSVDVNPSGKIVNFREKNSVGRAGWINAGIYLISHSLISNIEQDRPVSLETDIFPRLLSRGMYGFRTTGSFIDIGTPDSYRESQAWCKKRQLRLARSVEN